MILRFGKFALPVVGEMSPHALGKVPYRWEGHAAPFQVSLGQELLYVGYVFGYLACQSQYLMPVVVLFMGGWVLLSSALAYHSMSSHQVGSTNASCGGGSYPRACATAGGQEADFVIIDPDGGL